MKLKPDEITAVLKKEIEDYQGKLAVEEVGTILEVGDGIARVYGLSGAMAGEMVEFENGAHGLVFNLEESNVGIVVLGDYLDLHEGDQVKSTGRVLEVPVGEDLIGRVVNPLGQPIDSDAPIETDKSWPLEFSAPGIAARQPVNVPLQTGLKAVDSMIPIGRGQRELIIGDRQTGKTAIAVDTILNQADSGVICVYVAVGQKASTVAGVVDRLKQHGALDYTIVVAAGASEPAPLQYIAPYAGCAMAEYFMYEEGRDTLCVYDDLSKQADAYRQLSLLLRRPPGREAYPGDVFYLHSRLLERSARLAEEYIVVPKDLDKDVIERDDSVDGEVYLREPDEAEKAIEEKDGDDYKVARVTASGGSLTALPIVETKEGEVSAYIPTNVISITDGQIYLEPNLFFAGVRPAINVGISVSRVGGNAQIPAMKQVAGSLRLDLARYWDLEAFAQLGTELDKETQARLDRGKRMVELLKQDQYKPLPVEDQVIAIFAATQPSDPEDPESESFMDKIPVEKISDFERRLIAYIRESHREIPETIVEEKTLKKDGEPHPIQEKMRSVMADFVEMYLEGKAPDPRSDKSGDDEKADDED